MPLLAARDLQPLAVDVSCEVLSDTDKPSPDSLPAQLGMDHQRRDATQPAYLVKERDCVEAEKSGKSFSLAENRIRAIHLALLAGHPSSHGDHGRRRSSASFLSSLKHRVIRLKNPRSSGAALIRTSTRRRRAASARANSSRDRRM